MKTAITLTSALALTTALTSGAWAATKVGVIGAANPQVYVTDESGKERIAKVGDEIFLNDKLRTDGKGSAQLMFLDKSALTISPESAVTIDTFVYNPATKDGTMTVNGAKGAFRFIGGALTKKKAVKLKTPVSTIGIRGGIVDTHISAGGKTDALFLFGKEMTLTNAQGQSSSTTQFGSGLGMATPDAAPVALPQNIVAQHITNSPTQAAVTAAPPSSPAQIDAIETKVSTGASGKAGNTPPAPDGPAGGSAPASNDGGGGESSSSSSAANDSAGNASAGEQKQSNTPSASGDAAPEPSTNTAPTAAAGNANDAPKAVPAPKAPAFGGLADGAGLKPASAPTDAADIGSLGTQQLQAKIENFVASGGDADGDGRADFDITNVDTSNINVPENRFRVAQQNPPREGDLFGKKPPSERETAEPLPIKPMLPEMDEVITAADGENSTESDIIEPPLPSVNNTPSPPPSNFFGQTADWSVNAPTLSKPATKRGRYFARNDVGNGYGSDDAIDTGRIRAFRGTTDTTDANYVTEFDGKDVFILHRSSNFVGNFAGAGTTVTSGDTSNYKIGTITAPSAAGYRTLVATDFKAEDLTSMVDNSTGFDGFSYLTQGHALTYYQASWDEGAGRQNLRAFLLASPLFNPTDVTSAQSIYDNMISNAASSSYANNGIIEYDFLPSLIGDYHGGTEYFGQIDYNSSSALTSYGASYNNNGLFVDWGNKKFLGGYVDFEGNNFGNPAIRVLFGKVNGSTGAITALDPGGNVQGTALGGSYYALDQYLDFSNSGRDHLDVSATTLSMASNGQSGDAIEGFVVQTRDPGATIRDKQLAVIGDGAAALSGTAPNNEIIKGFTAGIITDSNNEVSRIATGTINDFTVQTNAVGTINSSVTYTEKDGAGNFTTGNAQTITFGSSSVNNAVLEEGLYAAEVNTPGTKGDDTKGVIVSMNKAIAGTQADLVCSTCSFAHWGVWQADHISSGNAIEKTALVPYIAGQVTSDAELTALAGTSPGDVVYNGNAVANIAVIDNASGVASMHNAVGNLSATVDLDNRLIAASSFNVDFTDIGSTGRALSIKNHSALDFTASNGFTGTVQTNFTDANNVSTGYTDMNGGAGKINGVFFGSNAEEIGGNFYAQGATDGTAGSADETIRAGGIYHGKR